jgi:hypothetical protein
MPNPLVLTVRISALCSSTAVTLALGIMLPEASLISPAMPPSVCCANIGKPDRQQKMATANDRMDKEERMRVHMLKMPLLENKDFLSG